MTERNIEPIARAICAALGATLSHDKENTWYARAVMPDGVTLGLHLGYGNGGRLEVSPYLVGRTTPRDVIQHDEEKAGKFTTRISIDPARPADKIAADIKRRLLPDATTLHARAIKRAEDTERYEAAKALTLATLAQRLKCAPRPNSDTLYPGGVSLQVTGPDNVSIDRIYCKAETAARIVELLKAEKAADTDEG